eukprot:PLAT7684.1.p1 GENE.PLAT7684.1~~PLAT7684.1.p1  ORF type:complete len:1089 (+),score=659.90 PLAT7684.1:30-3269(+)
MEEHKHAPADALVTTAVGKTPAAAGAEEEVRDAECKLFTWGRGDYGQLMRPVGDSDFSAMPTEVERLSKRRVVAAAGSLYHSIAITDSGEVFISGNNEEGQLCSERKEAVLQPGVRMESLSTQSFVSAACGSTHSMLLSKSAVAVSFGSNEYGQLGHSKDSIYRVPPRMVRGIAGAAVVQIAAGELHTLVLTGSGQVFSFGSGAQGALGHDDRVSLSTPKQIMRLAALPVVAIAAGNNHSLALTAGGRTFAWGRNNHGQLGLSRDRLPHAALKPVAMPPLFGGVRQLAAGGTHSAFVTTAGELFMCGKGSAGQLGCGDFLPSAAPPVRVEALAGTEVREVACGESHTLVLSRDGRLFAFGAGNWGQLAAAAELSKSAVPVEVRLPSHVRPFAVAAGGDHCMALAVVGGGVLAGGALPSAAAAAAAEEGTALAAAVPSTVAAPSTAAAATGMTVADMLALVSAAKRDGASLLPLRRALTDVFGSLSVLNGSFLRDDAAEDASRSSGLDVAGLEALYAALLSLGDADFLSFLLSTLTEAARMLQTHAGVLRDPDALRGLLIVWQSPLCSSLSTSEELVVRLVGALTALPSWSLDTLLSWVSNDYAPHLFASRLVAPLQEHLLPLTAKASATLRSSQAVNRILRMLEALCDVNDKIGLIPFEQFNNSKLCSRLAAHTLAADYQRWRKDRSQFSFCRYAFVLDADAKRRILQYEAALQKEAIAVDRVRHLRSPFLVLEVARETMMQETLRLVSALSPVELKKPLKIIFRGEEGVDEGGLTKEFFTLLLTQLFDPAYGMYVYDDKTRTYWFTRDALEGEDAFFLVGLLLGLAIYNGVRVDVRFPLVVYKKLLGLQPTLADVKQAMPALGDGLQQLLDYEGDDLEDVFCTTFEASYDSAFGERRTEELLPGGADVYVTQDNKHDYVSRYVRWLMTSSIAQPFEAFARGFVTVMDGPALHLFRAHELEVLIAGVAHLDFAELRAVTQYEGYTADSPVVAAFWQVVQEMTLDEQRALLTFVTGSAKAPIGGLRKLLFKIQRAGPDCDRLPQAAVCFNLLLLPEYASKEKLRDRLSVAIREGRGFGLK